jgi:hypothetical protein
MGLKGCWNAPFWARGLGGLFDDPADAGTRDTVSPCDVGKAQAAVTEDGLAVDVARGAADAASFSLARRMPARTRSESRAVWPGREDGRAGSPGADPGSRRACRAWRGASVLLQGQDFIIPTSPGSPAQSAFVGINPPRSRIIAGLPVIHPEPSASVIAASNYFPEPDFRGAAWRIHSAGWGAKRSSCTLLFRSGGIVMG